MSATLPEMVSLENRVAFLEKARQDDCGRRWEIEARIQRLDAEVFGAELSRPHFVADTYGDLEAFRNAGRSVCDAVTKAAEAYMRGRPLGVSPNRVLLNRGDYDALLGYLREVIRCSWSLAGNGDLTLNGALVLPVLRDNAAPLVVTA